MGGFLSTSHAHNHTSSSAGPPPGSNPPAHPHSITRLSRGTLLFMWIFFIFFYFFFMTYKYMYVYHQRYLYIHCCTSNYIKREPQSNPLWSSGELLIPQTWAVCFGLFKLPTHSTTKDKVRPLHLFLESKVRLWLWG